MEDLNIKYNAASALVSGKDFYFDSDDNIMVDDKIFEVTKVQRAAATKTAADEINKERVERALMELADFKQESVYRLVLGYKATYQQIERYRDKYVRAKLGDFTDKENAAVIQKFEAARTIVRKFTDMIELFRSAVDDLIQNGELDKAEKALRSGRDFDETTTIADVTALLAGL